MKNIREKEQLIKMALALGLEPDPKILSEVLDYKKMMSNIKKNSSNVVEVFEQIAKIKDEEIIQEPPTIKPTDIPKPPSLDEISFLLEEKVEEKQIEVPKPPTLDEVLEKLNLTEEAEKPKENIESENKLVDLAVGHITKEVMNEQKAAAAFVQPEVPLPQTITELKRKVKMLEEWIAKISLTGPGSGEVNLLKLDDVDTTALGNNKYLRYNSANGKIEFASVGGGGGSVDSVNGETGDVVLSTANIAESGNLYFTNTRAVGAFTAGTNISIQANGLISANVSGGGGGGSVDLGNVSSNIVPTVDSTFNLGSPTNRFKTLYLANNTIDLGGSLIQSDGTGTITISGSGAVLPVNSKISVGDKDEQIALVSNTGTIITIVPFYTQLSGLNTVATNFQFGANPDDYVFTNFTLSNGSGLEQAGVAQFYF